MRVGTGLTIQTAPSSAEAAQRWSPAERTAVYQRVLGASGGTTGDVQANRALTDLWLRFVTNVAQRSQRDSHPANSLTLAARDFATAALPRIDAAWSQRDMWNVIDQVSTTELGGTANTARHRSLAETGGAVLEWVSTHRDGVGNGLATDRSLADAVAQWLAVTVTSGDDVEALSQPEIAATRVLEWSRALFGALGQPQGARGSEASTQPRLVAWFEGAADTGKTLAAHWLAASVGGAVERVDLAQMVSKYMGETEKNLDRVFSSASTSGAVLLFDEADALLGKRTDVRDSHDRYANLESNVLLQRLEQFEGVAVLTSNAAARIDPDLRQRAKAVFVAFPLPPR